MKENIIIFFKNSKENDQSIDILPKSSTLYALEHTPVGIYRPLALNVIITFIEASTSPNELLHN